MSHRLLSGISSDVYDHGIVDVEPSIAGAIATNTMRCQRLTVVSVSGKLGVGKVGTGGGTLNQMNISITQQLSAYVRKKVRSGRYNNASEVVRDALRRMEEEDARAVRLAQPTAEDLLTDLTGVQLDAIRRRVQSGIESIERGDHVEYSDREGLKIMADGVESRGRKLLIEQTPGE
jgi:antitoxin ParD1/3/4